MDTRIRIRVEGVSPLLLDACTPESVSSGNVDTGGGKPGKPRKVLGGKEDLPRQQAEKGLYRSVVDGETLVIPADNLFPCLRDAGKFHKVGKKQITTRDESIFAAGINLIGIEYPIEHAKPWEVDIKVVTNENTKGKMVAYRPRFDAWALEFELNVDTSMFPLTLVRELVDDAGMKISLGTRRVQKRGHYGKFKVVLWEVLDQDIESSKKSPRKKTARKKAKGRRQRGA